MCLLLRKNKISDSVVSYIVVNANDSMDDCLYIDDYDLNAGDEIVITAMLTNANSFEDIGGIEFTLVLE